jgi:hypothetical protein
MNAVKIKANTKKLYKPKIPKITSKVINVINPKAKYKSHEAPNKSFSGTLSPNKYLLIIPILVNKNFPKPVEIQIIKTGNNIKSIILKNNQNPYHIEAHCKAKK